MLSRDRAQFYYKSLHFNHYESGGTCEQCVLVLRARFDRILEELSIKDFDSQNVYVEKLQQVFSALPNRFTEEKKKECHALRRYLNGVQHSTFEPDESQYKLSVKRLCELIRLCSEEEIPLDLKKIWIGQEHNSEKCKKDVASTLKKENSKGKADKIELPFVLCIDCLFIEKEEKKRLQFNNALRNLISKIADDELDVNLRLILIGNNKIKYIDTKIGETSVYNYQRVCEDVIVNAIDNSCDFFKSRLKYYNDNNYTIYKPSGLAIFMLSAGVSGLVTKKQETLLLEQQEVQVIPVGLTSGMDLEALSNLSQKNAAVVLKEDKFEMFFNWMFESLKMICTKKNKK
ncbi:hypothetical protein [Prevotella melaninogenica]|jgi:hypothetical protein